MGTAINRTVSVSDDNRNGIDLSTTYVKIMKVATTIQDIILEAWAGHPVIIIVIASAFLMLILLIAGFVIVCKLCRTDWKTLIPDNGVQPLPKAIEKYGSPYYLSEKHFPANGSVCSSYYTVEPLSPPSRPAPDPPQNHYASTFLGRRDTNHHRRVSGISGTTTSSSFNHHYNDTATICHVRQCQRSRGARDEQVMRIDIPADTDEDTSATVAVDYPEEYERDASVTKVKLRKDKCRKMSGSKNRVDRIRSVALDEEEQETPKITRKANSISVQQHPDYLSCSSLSVWSNPQGLGPPSFEGMIDNEDAMGSTFNIRGENVTLKRPCKKKSSSSRSLNEEVPMADLEMKSDIEEKL